MHIYLYFYYNNELGSQVVRAGPLNRMTNAPDIEIMN